MNATRPRKAPRRKHRQRTGPAGPVEEVTAELPSRLLGGFRVMRVLGAGSRSEVLLAHENDSEPVALKYFRDTVDDDDVDRELIALSSHDCPHLLGVRDVATTVGGRCIAVLPRLSGPLLASLLRERGADWQLGELVTVAVPLVVAVAAAHAAGFAHGDISARTIMLDETGAPVLIGLGRTIALRIGIGEAEIAARSAMRLDYQRLGELLTQLFAHLDPGEERENESFEEWYVERLARTPFEPFAIELERLLLEMAVPVPIRTDPRSVAPAHPLSRVPVPAVQQASVRTSLPAVVAALAFLPDEFGLAIAQFGEGLRMRVRGLLAKLPSRKPLVAAAVLCAVLLGAMLVWPAEESVGEESVRQDTVGKETVAEPTGEETVPPAPSSPPVSEEALLESDDPVVAFPALIEARAACLDALDSGCLAVAIQPGSALESADATAIRAAMASGGRVTPVPATTTEVSLVERTGDAVIVAYTGVNTESVNSEPASALMIRTEAGWRLRELFEPSGSVREGD